jgi:hypothetical protein
LGRLPLTRFLETRGPASANIPSLHPTFAPNFRKIRVG